MTPGWMGRSSAGKNESQRSYSSSPPQRSCGVDEEVSGSAQRFQFHDKPCELGCGGVRPRHQHEVSRRGHPPFQQPERLAQPPFRTISPYRSPHTATCRHRHPPGIPGRPEVENEGVTDVATAFPIDARKLRPARDPVTPSYYDGARRRLARNRLRRSTFRPPGVRIRTRNPCVLLRCRRFG
jgi:hypothetical protein